MRRPGSTARGFVIILAIAGVITAFSLEPGLDLLFWFISVAFFLALAFFLYRLWRERREEIATWPVRSRVVFYGAIAVSLANVAFGFVPSLDWPANGLETLVFIGVLVACGFAMWRVWRDQHTYSW